MYFVTRNVNTAFTSLVKLFNGDKYAVSDHPGPTIVKRPSRNGPVLMIDEPVMVTYTHPKERVLFNQARDANPFLHLFESMWMLAGRNDVAPLAYYAKQFEQYSDDGRTLNGAYGYRWRSATAEGDCGDMSVDQLKILIDHIKADPTSRRAVLQMWNVEDDLLKIGLRIDDKNKPFGSPQVWVGSRDVCCNTAVYFSINDAIVNRVSSTEPCEFKRLDMTVTNRSNDMIWGMLGANVVHFSFLQEYMAAQIGVEVGRYTQMTNNLHVYENNWKPDEWLNADNDFNYNNLNLSTGTVPASMRTKLWGSSMTSIPLVKDPATFDKELPEFVEKFSGKLPAENLADEWKEPFLQDVAQPMLIAFACHKERDYHSALQGIKLIEDTAWSIAAYNWLSKRSKNYESK